MEVTLRSDVLALAADRYATRAEYLFARDPDTAILRHPNKKWYGAIMRLSRGKLGLSGDGVVDVLNVKCDPVLSGSLRTQPGILPGYHMNKQSWITILLDGTVALDQIAILLDMSYDLVGLKTRKAPRKT